MKKIQEYLNLLIENDGNFKAKALKRFIMEDYLKSGIIIFNNDSTNNFHNIIYVFVVVRVHQLFLLEL